MIAHHRRIGYAYTPTLGEKPVYSADVEIDGQPYRFEVEASDVFEIRQII